jgi:hypothetical protein
MSFYSNPIGALSSALGQQVSGEPGTVGPAPPGAQLIPNGSGGFIDPRTGQTYADPTGRIPVGNVNLNQQTGANTAVSNNLLTGLGNLQGQQQQAFGGQQQLVGELQGTINGTAPSVALTQLGQGQDAIARQQMAQASGVGGANAAAARLGAAANTANAQAAANQQGALIRAQEIAQAEANKGGVLAAEQAGATGMGGVLGKTAADYASNATQAAATAQTLNQKSRMANAQANSNLLGTLGGSVAKLGGIV